MKVKELSGEHRMIDIPDEWGETAENIKELIPALKAANTSGNSVYISIGSDGYFSVSVSNYSKAPVGGTWHYYTDYTTSDGLKNSYVNEYTREEE
jgi:hypothetical protein